MRTKQAFYNVMSSIILQVIIAVSGFILPPIRIKTYGSSMNGLIGSIGQFIAYLQVVEAGLNTASVQALYKPLSKKDHNQTGAILSASRKFYTQSGAVFAALVALLSIFYPMITKEEVSRSLSFALVLIISVSGLVEFFIGAKYRILLTADQKGYILNCSFIAGSIINTVLSIIIMMNEQSIVLLQLCSSAVYFIRVCAIVFYVRRKYRHIDYKSEPDHQAMNKRWHAFVHQLAGIVIFNTPVVMITIFCGLKEVSIYMIYSVVFTSLGALINTFSSGLTPAFGELISLGDKSKLNHIFNQFEVFYYALISFVFSVTAVLIIPFITIYTNGIRDANYMDPALAALFMLVAFFNHIRIPHNLIVSASGHFKETKWRAIIEAIIHVTMSLTLVQFFGLYGVLLGSVCSYGYRSIDLIIYGNTRILMQSPWHTVRRLTINMIPVFVCMMIFTVLLTVHASTWISLLFQALGISMASLLLVIGVNLIFNKEPVIDIRNRMMNLAGSLFRKKKVVSKQV